MKASASKKTLTPAQRATLLQTLQTRFEAHAARHPAITWPEVESRLLAAPAKLWSLGEMEKTGGEPDVVGQDKTTREYIFADCSPQSPSGRHSICYDREALESRKEHKPRTNVLDMATEMGVELLDEEAYRELQKLGEFDTKTSSWVRTPADIRKQGGALYCDRRYGRVFVSHNGAQSYYSGRGFRASLKV